MYGSGRRFGLGRMVNDPSTGCDGLPLTDPCWITLPPAVTMTPGTTDGSAPDQPLPPMYGPEAITPTSVPQVLPPMVVSSPPDQTHTAVSPWLLALLVGVGLFLLTRPPEPGTATW